MDESGIVKSAGEGKALVELKRGSACDNCGMCIKTGPDTMEVEVVDNLGVSPGDRVKIDVDETVFLKAAAVVYGLPALVFISVLIYSEVFTGFKEWQSAVAALAAMAFSYVLIVRYDRRKASAPDCKPYIVEICADE